MSPSGGFDDYFAGYVGRHTRPATRWLHFAGAHLGAVAAAVALIRRRPAGLLALPVISYGSAWFSHRVVEGNGSGGARQPLRRLHAELRMIAMMWQGRDDELTRIGRDHRAIVLGQAR